MRTKNGILTVEDQRFPLIDVVWHEWPPDTDLVVDYREAFELYAQLALRRERMVYLLDMRTIDPLRISTSDRKRAAEIFHTYLDRLLPVSVAEARVISSPLTRGLLTTFDWLTGANKWPCQQFATLAEGEAWVRSMLQRASASPRG